MQYGKQDLFKYLNIAPKLIFEYSPNGKGMVYGPNGKGIMASLEYTLIIYSPNGKGMVLKNNVFPNGNRHCKRYNFGQN